MRLISKTDHEDLQKKMKAVVELLQETDCLPAVHEEFNTKEVVANREKLDVIYQEYVKQMEELEETILQYRFHHMRMNNLLREKYRLLNRKLDNNTPERKKLGLPAEAPVRTKVVLKPDALSRSRYYHSRKK